ncbi:HAMP domain-containing sensor histidine kinase [Maridesulfovibrio sp.]|uniref:sensor histidine kinase n=1 Tax=Maridesulfovibrio sp. TaxID=2795000 RepID=UPI002A18E6BB|nr:HAMP domain-containing sensor histidine kinase [Maridesulfovibrio sp.]
MDNLPSLNQFGEQLDLLKKFLREENDEQADSLAQTIFETYAFSRGENLRLEDDLIAEKNMLSVSDERAEHLEVKLREAVSACNSGINTFRRFCAAQQHINGLKSVAGLPELMSAVAAELDIYKISVVLDRGLCSGLPSEGIPTFYLKGCMRYIDATFGNGGSRVYIGPVSKMMRPDIFFGDPKMSQDIGGSCFSCGLTDKYHPGELIGLFSIYDPSEDRYHPDMGTDFLEHFCGSFSSTLVDVINHQRAELLRQDVERITRHDLKTPLNAVINLPHLLLASEQDSGKAEMIRTIQDAGYKMLGLLNRSYDIYLMESGTYILKPEKVDLLEMAGKIRLELLDLIENKNLVFEISVNGNVPSGADIFTVMGEELLLFSMLANLVRNSVEAAPKKSTISIRLDNTAGTRVEIHNLGEVPPSIRDNFFEKYITCGKKSGTGLGTYSARLIARTHGGDLEMNTSAEDGTTLVVIL